MKKHFSPMGYTDGSMNGLDNEKDGLSCGRFPVLNRERSFSLF
ncbi:hypothetical protein OM416_13845 [Paenibacillus sp. LS1]|nr:hypothetical protein [Paenibacillus sp. LS1]